MEEKWGVRSNAVIRETRRGARSVRAILGDAVGYLIWSEDDAVRTLSLARGAEDALCAGTDVAWHCPPVPGSPPPT